jgi:hypothetical protein
VAAPEKPLLTPQKASFHPSKSCLKIKAFPQDGPTLATLAGWTVQAARVSIDNDRLASLEDSKPNSYY